MNRRTISLATLALTLSLGAVFFASTVSAECPGQFKSAVHLGHDTVLPADSQGVILDASKKWFVKTPKAEWYEHFQMVNLDKDAHKTLQLHINNSPAGERIYLIEPVGGFIPGDRYQLRFSDCVGERCDVKHRWDFEIDTREFREVLGGGEQVGLVVSELQKRGDRVGREVVLDLPESAERWRSGLLYTLTEDGEASMSKGYVSTSCASGALAHDEQVMRYVRASLVMPGVWDAPEVSSAAHIPLSCDLVAGQFTPESLELTKATIDRESSRPTWYRFAMLVFSALTALGAAFAVRRRFDAR